MDFLTIRTPEGDSQRLELVASLLRIGRSSANEIVLVDLNVSRLHAQIERRPDGCYVCDAGGKNGTFLNEQRLTEPALLRAGDCIRVGTTALYFNGAPSPAVEFSDRPLPKNGATRFLPAGQLLERPLSAGAVTPALRSGHPISGAPSSGSGAPSATVPLFAPGPPQSSDPLSIIFEADKELVFHRPLDEILEIIMDLARRAVVFEHGLLMLLESGELVPRVVRVPSGESGRPVNVSRTVTDRVVRRQESILTSDALLDERFREGKSVEAQHIRSVMCVPLWNNHEVIGLVYVDSRHHAGLYTEDSLLLLTHLANVAAVKIENARLFAQALAADRMEQELQKAAEIQNHLLPGVSPPVPGYELHGCSVPCREVGGDCFDYIELPGGRVGLGLADVAGKGLPSALLMCGFQASLRVLCELNLEPGETLGRMNRMLLLRMPANRFVTSFYAVLDPHRHELTYVGAGHNPPILVRRAGAVERLVAGGPPLGLFAESAYGATGARLEPGDMVLIYSDGVTEAANPAGEEFGEERLTALARRVQDSSPFDICRCITEQVRSHLGGAARQDDLTVVVLKRL